MKKRLLVMGMCLSIFLVGCSGITKQRELAETQYTEGNIEDAIITYEMIVNKKNKSEDLIRLNELKTEKYQLMAEDYYSEGDLKNAIDLYSKVLELNESVDARNRLTSIQKEQESINVVDKFINSLKTIQRKMKDVSDIPGLADVLFAEEDSINEFDKFKFDNTTKSGKYALKIKEDFMYQMFLDEFENESLLTAKTEKAKVDVLSKALKDPTLIGYQSILFEMIELNLSSFVDGLLRVK